MINPSIKRNKASLIIFLVRLYFNNPSDLWEQAAAGKSLYYRSEIESFEQKQSYDILITTTDMLMFMLRVFFNPLNAKVAII